MLLEKTVCTLFSSVTQPHLALRTVPRSEDAPLCLGVASSAVCSSVLGLLGGITHRDRRRKVAESERTHNPSTTTSPSSATVISYQLSSKLEMKDQDGAERCVLTEAFLK